MIEATIWLATGLYVFGGGYVSALVRSDPPALRMEWWKEALIVLLWPLTIAVGLILTVWESKIGVSRKHIHLFKWNLTWDDLYREHGRKVPQFEERWTRGKYTLFRFVGRQT